MTYALRFLPQVEMDARNGRAWYERKSAGLGAEVLRVIYTCTAELTRDPQVYPRVHGDFRRRLLRRFPYAIYFRIRGEQVVVFGLFHCARDPRRLQRELGNRQ